MLVLGTVLGTVFGLGLLYGNMAIRGVIRAYVDILRGMPLIVTIFLIFYGLSAYEINFSPFQSIALALSVFTAAHMAEIVRGVRWLDRGRADRRGEVARADVLAADRFGDPAAGRAGHDGTVDQSGGGHLQGDIARDPRQPGRLPLLDPEARDRRTGVPRLLLAAIVVYFVCCFAISRAGAWATRRMRVGMAS